jgi:hypothetical protein
MKMDLLTNATVVDDAVRFISQKSTDNLKPPSISSDEDENESNEPDYNEDKDQLEEQEEESGEATGLTTNQISEVI